jgi:hypothetical protein
MSTQGQAPATPRALTLLSMAATGLIAGLAVEHVADRRVAPWIIGRASGVCAYALLVTLVLSGLLMSHPLRRRRRGTSPASIRLHIALAVFTLVFTVLHVVVLAGDRYAGVGWWGALLPLRADYRPAAVSLGILGVWTGLLAGLSAAAAGHLPGRIWWPMHKAASGVLVLVWLHGVLAGGDTPALRWLYVVTGAAVALTGLSRFVAVGGRAT